jgi:dolichol-phosphate mannosyltransferase
MNAVQSPVPQIEAPISFQQMTHLSDIELLRQPAEFFASTREGQRGDAEVVVTMELAMVVPTLNEGENIVPLLEGILAADERLHAIIVDDGSTDGTAAKARDFGARLAEQNGGLQRVHLIERGRKLGYASAIQDGMRYALRHGAQLILQMDADFSHDPKYLPAILQKSRDYDVVLGSRYIPGGGTRNWGLDRKILSGGANGLVRLLLKLPAHDCTGGYRCWKRELVETSGVLDIQVQGYAFQFMVLDNLRRQGARIGEVPIIFVDRQFGKSKLSRRIIIEAGQVLFSMFWRRITRH